MEGNIDYITYGENEKETVINGMAAIREVLMGGAIF